MTEEKVIIQSGKIDRSAEGTQAQTTQNEGWTTKTVRVTVASEGENKRVAYLNRRLRGMVSYSVDTSK